MSWTDDEIDALFKEIPTQHKPSPFQDSFFDEIEHLLPKKRRKTGLFWVLGSALVALMTTFIYSDALPGKTQLADSKLTGTLNPGQKLTASLNTLSPLNENENQNETAGSTAGKQGADAGQNEFTYTKQTRKANKPATANTNNTQPVSRSSQQSSGEQPAEATDDLSLSGSHETAALESRNEDEGVHVNPDESSKLSEENEGVNGRTDDTQQRPEFISPLITSRLSLLAPQYFNTDSEKQIQALYLPMLHRKHFLTVEAGAGFTENFIKMENSSQRPMPTASLGLSYQYRTKGLYYSAGFNWMNFSPNSLNLTRESKVYGFEANQYSQNIDYKWITMMEMPLTVGKRFRNSGVSLGISPSLVLGSMVDFTKTQNGNVTERSTIYGNMLGLKQYAASVNIAYDLQIARNLDFGVKISNMLLNPLDETRFIGQLNKNPFQAQVTLKKHFRIK
ncbi:MAG: hypothetical protein K0R65_1704 [Crocinitomicaceae bacterium]|jgi:hypothetical protein|nr:hypothetical protein [Crocinitomicaceae bacterium]